MATKVIVNIPGEEAYDVRIGTGVLDALGARMRGVPSLEQAERVLVVTDENVAPLYRDRARESLAAAGFRVPDIVVPAGEDTKSVEVAGEIKESDVVVLHESATAPGGDAGNAIVTMTAAA